MVDESTDLQARHAVASHCVKRNLSCELVLLLVSDLLGGQGPEAASAFVAGHGLHKGCTQHRGTRVCTNWVQGWRVKAITVGGEGNHSSDPLRLASHKNVQQMGSVLLLLLQSVR
jgi:hypothetical protein